MSVLDMSKCVLQCKITGDPQPTVFWYKDAKILKAGQDFKISYDGCLATLEITEIFPEDEGQYTCIAKNPAGEGKTTCTLTVIGEDLYHNREQCKWSDECDCI